MSKGLTTHNCNLAASWNNYECFQNCLHSRFFPFRFFPLFSWRQDLRERIFAEQEFRGSRLRQFDRIVECLAGSLSIYILYVYTDIVLYFLRSRARTSPSLFPFNVLMSPFTLIMSLHLVTADARYSLSWGSLLLDEPVTRSLFVILILLSRGSVHSGIKRASSRSPKFLSLVEIL